MKPNVIELGQDDEALLRVLEQSGSEAALAELVRRHRDLVLGVALRRTGDHGRAEEVAQNVFMALAAKASRLSAKPSLAAWLYRATLLECSEIMRSERSRKRTMDSFSKQALIDAEGQNVWHEALPVLDEVLQSLPDADRHMIRLRFFDGKSFQQIGEGLGKSEAAAQKQCERALERLCRLLRRKGVAVPASVLASGLATSATQAVPAALAAAISQGAVAGASRFALKTILIRPLEIMTQANIRGMAAVLLAASIPIAIQWNQNSRLQNEIAMLQSRSEAIPRETTTTNLTPMVLANGEQAAVRLAQQPEDLFLGATWMDASRLLTEWERALLKPDPLLRSRRIAELIGSLTPETAPMVAGVFEQARQSGLRFGEEHHLFLRAWGRLAGREALEHAVESAGGIKNRSEILAALAGWASVHPQEARAWVEAVGEGSATEAVVYGLLDGWATVDFHSAARYAESLPRNGVRDTRFRQLLLQRALASGGIAAAQQWVQSMSDGEDNLGNKRGAFGEVIQIMLYRNPSAAAQWIADNVSEPFLEGKAVSETATKLAEAAPVATLDWLSSLSELNASQLSNSAAKVMDVWARQDSQGAGNWLNQNPLHPFHESMVQHYARAIAGDHPHIALAWARSISDEKLSIATELATAQAYIQRAGDAGRQTLLAAGYTPDIINQACTIMMLKC